MSNTPTLTLEQIEFYAENGYLVVSGLIPDEVSAAAEAMATAAVTQQAAGSTNLHMDEQPIIKCYNPTLLAAAAQLGGGDPASYHPPQRAFLINTFPSTDAWKWPNPHIDHAIKDHGHKTFPYPFRLASMLFLNDVAPHGGGTIVWPGSHKQIARLAESDPEKYEMMWVLNLALDQAGLNEPIELTPKRGDILFYHCLCAHSGSQNTSHRIRLGINQKW